MPPLKECLEEYCAWLATLDPPIEPWAHVLLVDVQQHDPAPAPPHEYLERWHEIVTTVDRSWVNFAFGSSRDGVLTVVVEWFPPLPGADSWPVHAIYINWSGPPRGDPDPQWDRGIPGTARPDSHTTAGSPNSP